MLEARIAYTAPLGEGPHVEISARLPVWRVLNHFLHGLTVARHAGVEPEGLQAELDTLQAFRDDLDELLAWAGDDTAELRSLSESLSLPRAPRGRPDGAGPGARAMTTSKRAARPVVVWVKVEQRCVRCGAWVAPDTLLHGSFLAAAGLTFCKGEGIGRRRFQLSVDDRSGGYRFRRPTPQERKRFAPYVRQARETRRDVWARIEEAVQ